MTFDTYIQIYYVVQNLNSAQRCLNIVPVLRRQYNPIQEVANL